MATTCQMIVDRVKGNPLNASLTTDRSEMLVRIRGDQQQLFTEIAGETRDRFKTTKGVTSTNAAQKREIDLSAVTPKIERVLLFTLASGEECSQVDELDVEAELAPRYFVRGQKLIEVKNDWSTASGVVTGELLYVYGMTDIAPTGALTQEISLPDEWADLLVLPLRMYLHMRDPGRDPTEYDRLSAEREERKAAFIEHLLNYAGVEAKRFDIPTPRRSSNKK